MTAITLTREFSGFTNVQDTWVIGSDDSKAGTIGTYELPEGYTLGQNKFDQSFIYDANDSHCEILTNKASGMPQLFSGAKVSPVLKAVEVVG